MTISRRARGILLLLLSALAVEGCSRYAATHVARGDAYFDRQSYGEAIDEYIKAERFQPDDPHIIRQLGFAHKALGHRPDAYAYLQKARELDPADTIVGVTLASMFLADGLAGQAITEASAVLSKAPKNLEALNLLGSAYLAKRDPAKAVETSQDSRFGAARCACALSRRPRASCADKRDRGDAVLPSGAQPVALVCRPVGATRSNRSRREATDAALARIQKQIAIAGDSAKLHELLGTVYLARGERGRADAAFRKAIALSPARRIVCPTGRSRSRRGEIRSGAGDRRKLVKLDPKNLNARLTQGVAYEQKGDKSAQRRCTRLRSP